MRTRCVSLSLLILAAATTIAAAAPLHLAKQTGFVGYSGTRWLSDYNVRKGHCDLKAISDTGPRPSPLLDLGAPRPANRAAAVLIGAKTDELVPSSVGGEPDDADRACIGHVLELGKSGKTVSWDNGSTGMHYEVTPDAGRDGIAGACRGFKLKAALNTVHSKRRAMACEKGPGLWQLTGL
jgi:hypothetical protein